MLLLSLSRPNNSQPSAAQARVPVQQQQAQNENNNNHMVQEQKAPKKTQKQLEIEYQLQIKQNEILQLQGSINTAVGSLKDQLLKQLKQSSLEQIQLKKKLQKLIKDRVRSKKSYDNKKKRSK